MQHVVLSVVIVCVYILLRTVSWSSLLALSLYVLYPIVTGLNLMGILWNLGIRID